MNDSSVFDRISCEESWLIPTTNVATLLISPFHTKLKNNPMWRQKKQKYSSEKGLNIVNLNPPVSASKLPKKPSLKYILKKKRGNEVKTELILRTMSKDFCRSHKKMMSTLSHYQSRPKASHFPTSKKQQRNKKKWIQKIFNQKNPFDESLQKQSGSKRLKQHRTFSVGNLLDLQNINR